MGLRRRLVNRCRLARTDQQFLRSSRRGLRCREGQGGEMSREANSSDVIVVGAGHNALVCAGYLAEAGLSVRVLEGRDVIGGNTITEELTLEGWQHDSCSSAHVVIQSNPLIARDELRLQSHYGLSYIVTDPAVIIPTTASDALVVYPDVERTVEAIARFSPSDAAALRTMMDEWSGGLRTEHAFYQAGLDSPDSPMKVAYAALRARSAAEVIETTFEHEMTRRAMTWISFATIQPPHRPGTGAIPAAIIAGRLNFGWTTPVGGSGALPQALAAHIVDHGGSMHTNAWVRSFLVEDGRCVGVTTSRGDTYRATRAVVTSSHITTVPGALPVPAPEIEKAAAHWQPGLSVFAVHFALRRHVQYRTEGGLVSAVAGGLGSPEGLARQVAACLDGRIDLTSPWLLMVDSTVVDPARAPGAVFKFLTIAPTLYEGRPWDDESTAHYAQRLVDVARDYVEGLEEDNIVMMRPESPTTIAQHNLFNIAGSCHGGEFLMDDGAVIPGWLEYRSDIPGLYLTGSTSHPGGSVSGRPGRNTARTVLEDLHIDPRSVMATP